MATSCRGHTLPLALAGSLVALAMLRAFHDRATSLVQSWRHARVGAALEAEVLEGVANAAPSLGRCSQLSVQARHGSTQRTVCYEALPAVTAYPRVALPSLRPDFDAVFSRASPCPAAPQAVRQRSFTSPVARLTCSMTGSVPATAVALENIKADWLKVAEPTNSSPALLATPGTLEVSGVLEVQGDSLVVSGGDTSIGSLAASKALSVTVVSARGSVEVRELRGPVSLVIVGTKSLRAPASPIPASFPLPPLRPPAILAIVAPDGSGK